MSSERILKEAGRLSYFIESEKERYVAYKHARPDLCWPDVVTQVNIGLDQPFYSDVCLIKNQHSRDVLVNKYRQLAADFIPRGLSGLPLAYASRGQQMTAEAKTAFISLATAAAGASLPLKAISTYRSITRQKDLWQKKQDSGRPLADVDAWTARSGHSEHHLGLAVDINSTEPEEWAAGAPYYQTGQWLLENAADFGFIQRYPQGKSHITGYQHEAWHFRFLGRELAGQVKASGLTYDEFWARQ